MTLQARPASGLHKEKLVQWIASIGLSTLVGAVLGLVVGIGLGYPFIGLILGLIVGVAFDPWARRRRATPPPE